MRALVVVPTFGRVSFLNRVLASFLSQDYDDKDLLIINDDPNVQILCDHKNVFCINLNKKVLVPIKRNIGAAFGDYDIIFPFDDDDIFLPKRISNHIATFQEDCNIDAYINMVCYIIDDNKFFHGRSGPSTVAYKKSAWAKVGGYTSPVNYGEDTEFIDKLFKLNMRNVEDYDNMDYIYNFSGINYHATSHSDNYIINEAQTELEEMNLFKNKFYIEPDYFQFYKFMEICDIFKETGQDVSVIYPRRGEIEIKRD